VDLAAGTAVIHRGKGGKARRVPFGPRTGSAIDRYLRARRRDRLAATPPLWLGDRGREFGYHGLRDTMAYRADRAGIGGFYLHRLRRTAGLPSADPRAGCWLSPGGRARTCCCATPAPARSSGRPTRQGD